MTTHPGHPGLHAIALTLPGLGDLLEIEARRAGLHINGRARDRRADLVRISRATPAQLQSLQCAEDVLLQLPNIRLDSTAARTAKQLERSAILQAVRSSDCFGAVPASRVLRPVVRLSSERHFTRSALRDAIGRHLGTTRPGGRSELELWVLQDGRVLRVGVRIPSVTRRGARHVERPGALRPVVAAAMVALLDPTARSVLDPCCGTGTVLAAVTNSGRLSIGGDLDRVAIGAAASNTAGPLVRLDARQLPWSSGSFAAVVSNLPFGRQHEVQGSPVAWYRRVLQEALRVAPHAVVLAPPSTAFRRALGRIRADLDRRIDVELLGQPATIWSVRRRSAQHISPHR